MITSTSKPTRSAWMKCSPFRAESAKCPSSTMRAPCRWDTVGPEGSEQLAVSRQPNPQSTDFNRGQSGLWRSGFRVSGPKSSNRCQPVRLRLMAVPHRLHVPNLLPPCRALDAQNSLTGRLRPGKRGLLVDLWLASHPHGHGHYRFKGGRLSDQGQTCSSWAAS